MTLGGTVRARRAITALAVVALLAACADRQSTVPPPSGSTSRAASTPAPTAASTPAPADWITYHHDNSRTGFAADLAPVSTLRLAWRTDLDGAVFGQPLLVGGTVLAATEADTVYALDSATGRVLWSTHLGTPQPLSGLPCGDIDPLGITSTMVYDPATGRVFAVAETDGGDHTLYGIDARTGRVAVHTPVEPPRGDRLAHQQRSALTLSGGRVYIAYGGLYGDCARYVGSVVSVTTAGTDPLAYAVPTTRQAGIWAPGGAVVVDGTLLYPVGNGESTSNYDGSDSVIALSPTLTRTDLFAPTTWQRDNAADLDLGSAGPVPLGRWVLAVGKRGTGYVTRAGHLGGVGGQVADAPVCQSFGGASVVGSTAYVPCTDGPCAVTIDANGTPSVRWRASVTANGSPTVGGGAVWVPDDDTGTLYALDQRTGQVLTRFDVGPLPHFASPTLAGRSAYLGTLGGVVAIAGA
jgi:polyvinyl alcohol dehydrogenase (cytochrome)